MAREDARRMKECPNCATDIRDDAVRCPICRYEFPARGIFPWKPVAVTLLVALLLPVLIFLFRTLGR